MEELSASKVSMYLWAIPSQREALRGLAKELARQIEKHGQQEHDDFTWITILGEEYGEACKAALEYNGYSEFNLMASETDIERMRAELKAELTQVAAVAIAHLGAIARRESVEV